MGTINYLINHEKCQLFNLGKGLSALLVTSCKSKEELELLIDKIYKEGNFEFGSTSKSTRAKIITDRIINTIGLENTTYIDNDDDLYKYYSNYILISSVYDYDTDIDKPISIKLSNIQK